MIDLVDHGLILKAGEIVYLSDLQWINKITGFVDQPDLNVVG
jgi:hypothetical protein